MLTISNDGEWSFIYIRLNDEIDGSDVNMVNNYICGFDLIDLSGDWWILLSNMYLID